MATIRVLITGAGGAPGLGLSRSLRKSDIPYHLIGIDADKYNLHRAETDERYLVTRSDDPYYVPMLKGIVRKSRVDFICVQHSAEMLAISEARTCIGAQTLLPKHRTLEICENKFLSNQAWKYNNLPIPETAFLNEKRDLKRAFKDFGHPLWIRAVVGSGGRGALPVEDFDTASAWIDKWDGWGRFTAAEKLTSQTVTWQSLWLNGELIVAQGRRRLYWEFANRAPSGVTGVTGTGVTYADARLDEIAINAILAIDPTPNGIFGVDMTYDSKGVPKLTEINCGRFFTTHQFFTDAGLNMPDLFVRAGLGLDLPMSRRLNPLPDGLLWIRGMDREPVLTTLEHVEKSVEEFNNRLAEVIIDINCSRRVQEETI